MGRAKMAMKFITKEKVRNSTFVKRNKGLFKKARELSILCNVPICVIIYNPHKEGKQPLEPEVYSFKGDDNNNANTSSLSSSSSNSSDMHKFAREMIDRYLRVPIEERKKRTVTLHDMLGKNRADQDDQVCATLGHDNNNNVNNSDNNNDDALLLLGNDNNNNNRVDSSFLDGFDHDQLVEFLGRLDQKIGYVKQRIDVIKGANLVPDQAPAEAEPDLLPYYDQPTPITSLINSAGENNQHNQMGSFHELIEGFNNQVPLFNNYPMMNNNNNNDNYYYPNQECYHQIVPFNNNQHSTNNNNVFTENQVGVTKFEDEEHGGSSNNWVMYNMMGSVGPIYCDQRSGFFDNGGATSSYGPGLPMSSMAPLQMMPRLQPNNVPLPWQRQYHLPIFY